MKQQAQRTNEANFQAIEQFQLSSESNSHFFGFASLDFVIG